MPGIGPQTAQAIVSALAGGWPGRAGRQRLDGGDPGGVPVEPTKHREIAGDFAARNTASRSQDPDVDRMSEPELPPSPPGWIWW